MIVIGLTGSLAMGKTTLARQCKMLGLRVCDADALVHQLFAAGGAAVALVGEHFPGAIEDGAVSRSKLSHLVLGDAKKLHDLEAIVHPLVRKERERFLKKARRDRVKIVVLDIPLLYETGAEKYCDYVIVAHAPEFLQTQRALLRLHMTKAKLASIRARQMKNAEKIHRADCVISTGIGKRHSLNALRHILARLSPKNTKSVQR